MSLADLVVRARIEETSRFVESDSGERRPVVSATVLEVLKGDTREARVLLAQHGHGVAAFEPGDEELLFLRAIEKSRELRGLAGIGGLRWMSLQGSDAKFTLDEGSRALLTGAVRDFAALAQIADPEARLAARRALTLRWLRSPDPRLSTSAVSALVAGGEELVTAATAAELEPLIEEAGVTIGVRLGVLAELERRGLVAGPPRWARLLQTVEPPDLLAVVRAAAAHPSPAVNRELIRLLGADDAALTQAAAVSLGVPGNDEAVEPLAALLRGGDANDRMAAIRGLGRIATTEALAALEDASRSHGDEATRRRAAAELRKLAAAAETR